VDLAEHLLDVKQLRRHQVAEDGRHLPRLRGDDALPPAQQPERLAFWLRELQRRGRELQGVERHLQRDHVRGVPHDRAHEWDDDVQREVRPGASLERGQVRGTKQRPVVL